MKKIVSILLILCLFTTVFAFEKNVVEDGLTEFIEDLADSAPAASTMNNVWSDGYVGQLIGIPPHFGVGASAGAAKMDITGVKKAAKELGISAADDLDDDFVLPIVSVEAVVGGLFFPFDISGSYMTVKEPVGLSGENSLKYKFDCFNLKIRFPILKQNLVLPNLSLGVGYSKVSGAFLADLANSTTSFKTSFASEVYSADVQLSKSVIFLTPYVGARLLASKSDNSWEYNFDAGIGSVEGNGTYKTADDKMDVSYQVFAGTSFNFLIFKLNANAAYDLKTKIWSAGLGLHAQL